MTTKSIYINGYFLTQPISGVQRFAINLLHALDKLLATNNSSQSFICLIPKNTHIKFTYIKLKIIKSNINFINNHHIMWEQLVLPFAVKSNFLVNLCNFAPLLKRNQLVVVHDVIPFRYPDSCGVLWGTLFRNMVKIFARRAKYLASVSQFSANEINCFANTTKQITVLGNSGEHINEIIPDEQILTKLGIKHKEYILSVSSQSHMIHKNFQILDKIKDKINIPIVIAGSVIELGTTKTTINKITIISDIIMINKITDNELKSLYNSAAIFIFPSLYEGFGIPILEAFHCHAPCVVSDIAVFHEICANAALYFDPNDHNDLIAKLNTIINNQSLQQQLINNANFQVKAYTWQKITTRLLNIINY